MRRSMPSHRNFQSRLCSHANSCGCLSRSDSTPRFQIDVGAPLCLASRSQMATEVGFVLNEHILRVCVWGGGGG